MSRANESSISLWRNRDYLILLSGQIVSVVGSRISQVSLPLLLLGLTRSTAETGVILALYALPYPLLGILAGVLVDRWDQKRVMIACEALNVVATGSIPVALWTNHLSVLQLALAALIAGTAFTFFNVAEVAAVPNVVTAEQLPAATAQNQATFSFGGIVGLPAGGALFQVSRTLPFLFDTLSYVVSLISLLFIRTTFREKRAAHEGVWHELRVGVTWMWGRSTIRALTLLTGGFNLVTGSFTLLVIVLARERHASPSIIGVMFAVAAAGAILGALLAPRVLRRFTLGQVTLTTLWVNSALFPLYIVAPNAIVIGIINAAAFVLGPCFNVGIISYRLSTTPDALRGRVNGAIRTIALGASAVGAAVGGVLIGAVGADSTVWIGFVGLLMLALLATLSTSVRAAPKVAAALQ